ncbi:hypothetical protein ACKWTF_008941 [Chironomus riparius]
MKIRSLILHNTNSYVYKYKSVKCELFPDSMSSINAITAFSNSIKCALKSTVHQNLSLSYRKTKQKLPPGALTIPKVNYQKLTYHSHSYVTRLLARNLIN